MEDLIGSGIVRLIPWIIPILLVASWLANTKTAASSSGGEEKSAKTEKSSKTAKAEKSKTSAPAKVSTPAKAESLDAGISDKDMTE